MRKIPDIIALQRGRSRGFSLVELLVAAAIGIIASLAIFQVFAVFEGQKRTTTSGGEAQTSGTLALFTVERELRQAGYGINNLDFLGCKIQGRDSLSATNFTLELIPVKITQGALGAPDTITVMYGSGELVPNPASISQNMPTESSDFKVSNRYGFEEGNIVIAAEAGKDCTLAQVSNLPGAPGQSDNVIHNPGNYTDPKTGAQVDTRYNPSAFPPGGGIAYTTNAKLFNIGSLPANNIYSIQNSQLALQQALFGAVPPGTNPLYDNIVQLQAQYGKDTNNNGVVDMFDEITPANTAEWAQVLAVRVAVVARSGLYEKDEVSPATIRLWENSAAAPTTTGPVWTLTADDRHYRYKVFQTVVPLRNMIWRP
jgi:type IV pilus assembly protein PilW